MASQFMRIVITIFVGLCSHDVCTRGLGATDSVVQRRAVLGENATLPCDVWENCSGISWEYVSESHKNKVFEGLILHAESVVSVNLHLANVRETDLCLYRCVCRMKGSNESVITSIKLTAVCEVVVHVNDDTLVLDSTYGDSRQVINIKEGDKMMITCRKMEQFVTNCTMIKESSFFEANNYHHLCQVTCIMKIISNGLPKECVVNTVLKVSSYNQTQSYKEKSMERGNNQQIIIFLLVTMNVLFVCLTAALLKYTRKLKMILKSQVTARRTRGNAGVDDKPNPVYADVRKPIDGSKKDGYVKALGE